jgi:hypothetical protein
MARRTISNEFVIEVKVSLQEVYGLKVSLQRIRDYITGNPMITKYFEVSEVADMIARHIHIGGRPPQKSTPRPRLGLWRAS